MPPHTPQSWMSFLLILIKFFLNRNVVDVLFQWLYLEKKKYYLLLVWATQSMFRIVANNEFSDAGRQAAPWVGCPAFLPRCDGRRGVKPGHPSREVCRGGGLFPHLPPLATGPPCNNLFQSLSPTRDAGAGVHWGRGCRALGVKS